MRLLPSFSLLLLVATPVSAQRGPDVPNFATPQTVVEQMLKLAGVTKDDVVYDLGCGDGRIVVTAAQKFGARGVGVDLDPNCLRDCAENARKAKVTDRVNWRREDIFKTEIAKATVVALYLSPELNVKLRLRLLKELKPGTRVVAHVYDMGDWKPDRVEAIPDSKYKVYMWVVPANIEGEWRWSVQTTKGLESDFMQVRQQYQEVDGTMRWGGRTLPIHGRLVGTDLEWKAVSANLTFQGRTAGTNISGTAVIAHPDKQETVRLTATRR